MAKPHAIPPELAARVMALDRRCDVTMHRSTTYPDGAKWAQVRDAGGIVRDHTPSGSTERAWCITIALIAGNPSDRIQTSSPTLKEAINRAVILAEARGWHQTGGDDAPAPPQPDDLPVTRHALDRITDLAFVYHTFDRLFLEDQNRTDLLFRHAGQFFNLVRVVMQDWLFVHFVSLAADAKSGGQDQVSLGGVMEELAPLLHDHPTVRIAAAHQFVELKKTTESMKLHRDKRIAHADQSWLVDPSDPLTPVYILELHAAAQQCIAFVKAIQNLPGVPPTEFEHGFYHEASQAITDAMFYHDLYRELAHRFRMTGDELLEQDGRDVVAMVCRDFLNKLPPEVPMHRDPLRH